MRWSFTLYIALSLCLVFYRTAAIVVSARNFASALLPCDPSPNSSNVSERNEAQFDEGFDNNFTHLENMSDFSSADDILVQKVLLNSNVEAMRATKPVAKLSLGRPPGNESSSNTSAASLDPPWPTSFANISGGALVPSPAPPSPARSLHASLQTSAGSGQTLSGSSGRDYVTKILKVSVGVLFVAITLLLGLRLFEHTSHSPATETTATDTNSQVRQWVRSLPLLSGDDVQKRFKSKSGYDCLHHQPQSIQGPVRLEGRVVAMPHSVLKAPLAQRNCVLFSASASAIRLDGVHPPPAAFYAMNSDFDLSLAVASGSLRIRVRGGDVALFDVASGWQRDRTTWARAPEHLQDFLHAHRAPNSGTLGASEELDFTECRLDVGAYVTCVGELRRDATGEIGIWPCQDSEVAPASPESIEKSAGAALGLTSWELLTPRTSPRMGKVMISDDPGLLRQSKPSLCSWMHSLCEHLRRARR